MHPIISLTRKTQEVRNLVIITTGIPKLPSGLFSKAEKEYLKMQKEELKKEIVSFNRLDYWIFICFLNGEKNSSRRLESCRKAGDTVGLLLNENKIKKVVLFDQANTPEEVLAFAEGMALGSYQFLKYKNEKKNVNTLKEIEIYSEAISDQRSTMKDAVSPVSKLNILIDAVYRCRTLINEPNSYLTATIFAAEVEKLASESGMKAEVLNKKKLEALQMGGILGVNKGSHEPPTFTILEWKPSGAQNTKPLVLAGKGVVYDSGGMNLKPGNFMQNMKDDMSGGAAVATVMYAVAKAKLPVYVMGLIPATDNRPGPKAIASSDIIRMFDGSTVEIIDTDAEGRLILADALSYAKKLNPALVIDLATLTGSAVRAIGNFGAVGMQVKAGKEMADLKEAGDEVHERIVEFPMWEEYGELLKSELADLKNLGPAEGGSITAAKFLEKFTDYPYIHLDIAGPAFLEKRDSYRGQGGTGFGVRLLFEFISNKFPIDKERHT